MKHPKLFASGDLYGALSAKGKLSLYCESEPQNIGFFIDQSTNWPGFNFPEWSNIKNALMLSANTNLVASGSSRLVFINPAVIALTNDRKLLTYTKSIEITSIVNHYARCKEIKSNLSQLSNITSLTDVEQIYLNQSYRGTETNPSEQYIYYPITCLFKNGTAKVIVWYIEPSSAQSNTVCIYDFESTDIVDVTARIGVLNGSKVIGFTVIRKGGVIDAYNPIRVSGTGNIKITNTDLYKSYNANIGECRLVGALAHYQSQYSTIWLLDSNNDVYQFDPHYNKLTKFFEDYYCTIPYRPWGDIMGDSYRNFFISNKGVSKTLHGDKCYFKVAEDKRYYQSALADQESNYMNYIYVNSKGQIEYSIMRDNNNSCKNAYTSMQAMFSDLGRYEASGLLTSKTPVNLLDKTSVSGFTVKGIEPANTKRRVAFKVEDKWNKLSAEGALTPLATQEITADSVLEEGNTVAELEAITTTTGLAGKLVYPAVALYADPEAEVMPTFGMTVNAEIDTTVNVYSYTGYSQEYSLSAGEDVQVVNVVAETETTGEGNVVVTARLKQGGEWTDYMALSDTAMKQASALQLKAVYTVTNTDGSQSAKVKNVTIRYTTSGATVNGVSTDIVTKTQRFTNDLVYAHCYVKHKKLQDAVIDAYCSLRKRPKSKSMYQFGNGTGALNTYKLPDAGINQDTLSVYVDGKAVYDFGYNTETSEITLTADKDTALSASYECGWEMSEWIKMVQGVSQVNDGGGYTTEYSYTVPTHAGYEYTVTAIKYSLVRPEGKVTEETIGVGTGKRQMIELPHFAKKETIVCNGAWSYDYDRKLLTIIAPEGEDIVISYDWIAETPTVYAVSAGWAD